jgi:hypothetical protein
MTYTITPSAAYGPVKWIVSATAGQGTHTTITAAITAATSGDTIFIRDGTYTENPTLKAGVNLVAFPTSDAVISTSAVKIVGKCTFSGAGSVALTGIELQTNSDFLLVVSGSSNSYVTLNNCYINCANNTGISYTTSGTSQITIEYCSGNLATTGISFFAHSAASGVINISNSNLTNTAGSSTASTCSAGSINLTYSTINFSITTSGTSTINAFNINGNLSHYTWLTHNSTTSTLCTIALCHFINDTLAIISIGAGATLTVTECELHCSATNVITGSGTLNYGGLVFSGSSSGINTTTTNPIAFSVAQGGTAASTFNINGPVISNTTTTGALASVTLGSQQLLVGNSSAAPTAKALSIVIQTFTSTGTYTPTSGMVYCVMECWGGGGGGGGCAAGSGNYAVGGGGGAGGYSRKASSASAVGASQSVTIGAAGSAGSSGNNAGGNGGDTSVGTICVGKGGTGGGGGNTTTAGVGGLGGIAGTGDITGLGMNGGTGVSMATVVTSTGVSGAGGSSLVGSGGRAITGAAGSGEGGTGTGSGGSGGNTTNGNTTGGAGTKGYVAITEYVLS